MRVYVEGVGLLGPGLSGWAAGRPILCGVEPYVPEPTLLTPSALLPAAERRRMGAPVKLAVAIAEEAFAGAERDPSSTATVFTSSSADGDNVHAMLEVLASDERDVSPTRFHNSVHNAAAGYWSLATQSRTPSTSLCAFEASFAAGLLEAAAYLSVEGGAAALIAYDHPYPYPLATKRPIAGSFGAALVLCADRTKHAVAALDVGFAAGVATATTMNDAGLEALRTGVPAARSLPLLEALARSAAATIVLDHGDRAHMTVAVEPCR